MFRRRFALTLALTAVIAGASIRSAAAQEPPLTVFAAASLTEVLLGPGLDLDGLVGSDGRLATGDPAMCPSASTRRRR